MGHNLPVSLAEAIIVGAMADALASGASKIALDAGKRLGILDDVRIAIRNTERKFGGAAATALNAWTASEAFDRLVKLCALREVTDDQVTESFRLTLRLSGDPSATPESAHELLLAFAVNWRNASLTGRNALVVKDDLDAARIDGLRDLVTDHAKSQDSRLNNVEGQLAKLIGSLPPAVIGGSSAHEIERDRINLARRFVNEGRLRAAEQILEELRASVDFDSLPEDLRFSALTNLGVAQMRLGDGDAGRVALQLAASLKPQDPIAISNMSVALLRSGDIEEAVILGRKAFEMAPDDQRTRLNLISVLRESGKFEIAEQYLLPSDEWSGDTGLLVAAAETFASLGRHSEAEHVARRALATTPDDVAALGSLATTILSSRPSGLKRISADRLLEAKSLLTRAITIAETWDDRSLCGHLYANRAALHGILGEVSEGIEDSDRALIFEPENSAATLNRGLFNLQLGRYEDALRDLANVHDENRVLARIPLATAAIQLKRWPTALQALGGVADDPNGKEFADANDLLLRAAEESDDRELLDATLNKLRTLSGEHASAAMPLAQYMSRHGEVDAASRLLRDHLSKATGEEGERIALELAIVYFRASRFRDAAEVFEAFATEDTDRIVLRHYITCLYNSGDWGGAQRWARMLKEQGTVDPVTIEIEAAVLEAVGDSIAAREQYRLLTSLDRANVRLRLKEIAADIRVDEREEATEKLMSLRDHELDDPGDLLRAAGLRDLLGLPGVMSLAYRALQLGYHEDEIQAGYIFFYLRHEDEAGDPEEVVDECEVAITTSTGPIVYSITSDENQARQTGWFHASSRLAQALRGHKVGDEVTVYRPAFGAAQVGTIDRIRAKYAAAFRTVMMEYPARFPDSKRVQVGEGDPAQVLEVLRQAESRRKEIERLYRSGVVGIGGYAALINRSPIEAIGGLMDDPTSRILAFTGDREESERESSALDVAPMIVDLTSVLTIQLIGIADEVATTFPDLKVAAQTSDEVDELLVADTPSRQQRLSLNFVGDRIVVSECGEGDSQQRLDFLTQIKNFIRKSNVVPASRLAEVSHSDRDTAEMVIGRSALAAIAVAAEGGVLCTDDLITKRLASSDWNVRTTSTMAILLHLRERRVIGDSKYVTALSRLAEANYSFLRFSGKDLYDVLEAADFSICPALTRLLESLSDSDLTSAAGVLAIFVRHATTTIHAPPLRSMVLDLAASAMIRRRDPAEAIAAFHLALKGTFQLLPQHLREVEQTLSLWQRRAFFL